MSEKIPYQWLLVVRAAAKRRFDTLPTGTKQGVFRQLRELLLADDPYSVSFVEMLKAKKFERIRKFRVGDFRIFFVTEAVEVTHLQHRYKGTLFLIDIRDRKDSY
jgi:mRNA-degrading endonuclease RelE of RelBE toxin-antitoxin system